MSGQHAFLAPSSAARTVQCTGSPGMAVRYPEESGPEALEGDAAHEVLRDLLVDGKVSRVGDLTSNGQVVTEDMLDGADMFLSFIQRTVPEGLVWHVEETIKQFSLHTESWGTPDFWAYDPITRIVHLIDYKFGHEIVEVLGNWQLADYLCEILHALGHVDGLTDRTVRCELTIVQPRDFHIGGFIRTWSFVASDIRSYRNILQQRYQLAMTNPTFAVGPECDHCAGRHACPALQKAGYRSIAISGEPTPFDLSASAVGIELRRITEAFELLEARKTGLEAQALAMIRRGDRVPYWSAAQGNGRTVWNVPAQQVVMLGQMMPAPITLAKPVEVVTPRQAIKLGMDQTLVDAMSMTPKTEFKLVRDDSHLKFGST